MAQVSDKITDIIKKFVETAKEDNIDISISLTKPEDYSPEDGAKFMVNFEKSRSVFGNKVRPFCMQIVEGGPGKLPWQTSTDVADNVYLFPSAGI